MLGRRLLGASLLIVPILTLIWLDDRLNFRAAWIFGLIPLGLLDRGIRCCRVRQHVLPRASLNGRPIARGNPPPPAVSFALWSPSPVVRDRSRLPDRKLGLVRNWNGSHLPFSILFLQTS